MRTEALETLARELFNGALPKLPADALKRRAVLAKEFADAHLTIPGVCKPDAQKLAGLAPAFLAIADSRQRRVDAFIAALPPVVTHADIRARLVQVMGERALAVNLLHARHAVAACLVLLEKLEGRDVPLDLKGNAADKLVARLDAALGRPARESLLPRGPLHIGEAAKLAFELSAAVLESSGERVNNCSQTAPQPARPVTTFVVSPAKAASKSGPSALTRSQFDALSPAEKMAAIKRGVKLTD